MIRPSRRSIVSLGAAAAGTLLLPRFAIGQADSRPTLDCEKSDRKSVV